MSTTLRDNEIANDATALEQLDGQPQEFEAAQTQAALAHPGEAVNPFRWFILVGLITAAILQVLDTTIVNVALPQMAGNLGATSEEIGWVVTGYILSNVIVLPMTAFLTQRFGRKRYLTFSIVLFIVASFFCGTSHSLGEIVFWRILQGAGGAALLSTSQATLVQVFPKSEQGIVQSLFLMSLTVAPTLGPTLGGYITDNYTWNWCFLINVPIGILAVFFVITFLHDTEAPSKSGTVDWAGIGLLAVGLGSMQYVLEEGERNDWFQDSFITTLAVISGIALVALVWWQLSSRNKAPVIDFRVLQNKTLAAALFLFVVLGFGIYGGTYLFPLLAQNVLGFHVDADRPRPAAGRRRDRCQHRRLRGDTEPPEADYRHPVGDRDGHPDHNGLDVAARSSVIGIRYTADTTAALLLRGLGTGFLFVPINQAAFASLKKSELQQASGLLSLSRQLGGSFGIALLATFVQQHIQFHRVNLLGNYSAADGVFTQRLQGLTGALTAHGMGAAGSPNPAPSAFSSRA